MHLYLSPWTIRNCYKVVMGIYVEYSSSNNLYLELLLGINLFQEKTSDMLQSETPAVTDAPSNFREGQ